MRVAVINVNKLARVRRTFRPGWRSFIILIFLLVAFFWWAVINKVPEGKQIADDAGLKLQLLILGIVILPILVVASFTKNGFARFTFAFITVFSLPTLLLIALVGAIDGSPKLPWSDRPTMFFGGLLVLGGVAVVWDFLIAPCCVLFLSVIPFGRAKAFRNQVTSSRLLWSGRWKGNHSQPESNGERLHTIAGARFRMMLAWVWFILGSGCFLTMLLGVMNSDFLPAVFDLELGKAWYILRHFEPSLPSERTHWTEDMYNVSPSFLFMFLGFGCFFVFGYFWTQWQRENMLIFRGSVAQHMTPSDILLLRTFKDDVKSVSREQRNWAVPFRIYQWVYTLEQLIANRLGYLGKVRLLDIERENRELLKKWWLKHWMAPHRLEKFLKAVFPAIWFRLPAKGGIRYYVDISKDPLMWQPDIAQAIGTARMIVVLLGKSTGSLGWEMGQILQSGLLEKTVFVMPPDNFKKNFRARWEVFIKYLEDNGTCDTQPLKKIKPQRVLAVCVHQDTLLVLISRRRSQLFYQAALDLATLFTVADLPHSRNMIYKHLN